MTTSEADDGPDELKRPDTAESLNAERVLDFRSAFLRLAEAAAERAALSVHDVGADEDSTEPPVAGHEMLLFHAVRDLERSETWRLVCGLWEYIGDRLGDAWPEGEADGEEDIVRELYVGYSLPASYWRDPRSDDMPAQYYGPPDGPRAHERLMHARALAYNHAAEEAGANQRYALATLLRRKAGLAWIASGWGERTAADGLWTPKQLLQAAGGKWREAARAYFRASLFEIRSSSDDEKGGTFGVYAPDHRKDPRWPRPSAGATDFEYFAAERDDVSRLIGAWERWCATRTNAFVELGGDRRQQCLARWRVKWLSEKGLCHNVGILEDALRAAGRGDEAWELLRCKHKADLRARSADIRVGLAGWRVRSIPEHWPQDEAKGLTGLSASVRSRRAVAALARWPFLQVARFYHFATRSATSIALTLMWLTILFVGVMPWILIGFADLQHCDDLGRCTASSVGYWDAARFSLGQALTVPPGDIAPTTLAGRWIVTVETLLAAFSLGYAIWVVTRRTA